MRRCLSSVNSILVIACTPVIKFVHMKNPFSFLLILSTVSGACFQNWFTRLVSRRDSAISPEIDCRRVRHPITMMNFKDVSMERYGSEMNVSFDYDIDVLDPKYLNYLISKHLDGAATDTSDHVSIDGENRGQFFTKRKGPRLPRLDEGEEKLEGRESDEEKQCDCIGDDIAYADYDDPKNSE